MKTFKLDAEIGDFDYEGFWGKIIGPKSVATWLKSLKDGEQAEIEINSPGGSVIAGLAIANGIKNSKAKIRAHIVGIAASMASAIACACDSVVMEEGSLVMIHDPWAGGMSGNAEQLRKEAEILDSMKQAIMAFYRSKFDRTEDEISAMMSEESWWNGREASERGFKCEVVKSDVKIAACACSFKNMPEEAARFVKAAINDDTMAKIKAEVAERERAEHESAELEERFEKRLAAAMKSRDNEINELKRRLEDANERTGKAALEVADYGDKCAKLEEANARINDLENQLHVKDEELAKAKADATSHADRADKAEREFAQARDQLAELNAAHAKLMGGVLTPNSSVSPEEERARELAAAGSAEERDAIRTKYRRAAKTK